MAKPKGLSINGLLSYTIQNNPTGVNNAKNVRVVRFTHSKDVNGLVLKTRTHEPGTNPSQDRIYEQDFFVPNHFHGPVIDAPSVVVSCACRDFMFRWEWVLNKRGSADIIYGNGRPPDTSNPNYLPGVCKHLFKILLKIRTTNFSV